MPPPLSLNMARVDREMTLQWLRCVEKAQEVDSFLARLLDALLTGVQRTLLALGRLHQFLLRLGLYNANDQ